MTVMEATCMGVVVPRPVPQEKQSGTQHLTEHEVSLRGLAYYEVVSTYGRLDLQQPGDHRGTLPGEIVGISSHCHAPRHDFAGLCFFVAGKGEREKHVA
jgi:hypothetical protein